jgi:hypothetical protein
MKLRPSPTLTPQAAAGTVILATYTTLLARPPREVDIDR